jgi:FG-GAP-like repeat/Abnormal spindle-like microcephaly-assoc'd, ASPM-SPD-2-Hydin
LFTLVAFLDLGEAMSQSRRLLIAVLCLVSSAAAQFETRATLPTLEEPESIAVGDFNHDGKLDLAVAAALQSSQVMVFLGNGDGTFQSPVNYNVGASPSSIATSDLNGDGNLDLAVVDASGIAILLGNGKGAFQLTSSYVIANYPSYIAIADINHDGKDDLVTFAFETVSVLFGNGDGTFQSPISFNPTYAPSALGIVDFNHDGKLDLAIGEQYAGISQVQIYFGNGDGTFREGGSYTVGTVPRSIAVSDFRGDGKLDLAVACSLSSGVSVLLGNGDGTFQQAVTYAANEAYWVAATDLNGDGKPDLAAASFSLGTSPPTTEVSVLFGNGDGTFQPPTTYPTGGENTYIAVGDFNGDKKPDLIVTDPLNNDILELLNTGALSFSPTTPLVFAPQLLGTESSEQTVSLTNTGTKSITISSMGAQGGYKLSNTCGKNLAAGAKCAIQVRSAPTTEGTLTGTVAIHDRASSKPQVIELSGAGTVVELTPASLSFGTQAVHTKSAPQHVQLTNTGSTALTISNVYLENNNWTSFSQTNNCASSLPPGGKCTLTVTFGPVKKGSLSADLDVYDSGGGTFQRVTLSGTGD